MWILPKQLLTSPSAPATEGSTLDYEEFCQLAEQSLMWRSKLSPLRTWLARWRRVPWMQRLSGQTLRPVIGRSFVTEWILSAAAIRANHSVRQGTARVAMTPDTSGLTSKGQLGLFDQDTASLRTSKDTLPLGLKTSATTWESWVTSLRQEYSARLKSAHLTREKGCSSWPTPDASIEKYRLGGNSQQSKSLEAMGRRGELGPPAPENISTSGKSQELWATAKPQNWPTPDTQNHRDGTVRRKDSYGSHGVSLHHKIAETENWPTPLEDDASNVNPSEKRRATLVTKTSKGTGLKLNPSWVEQLMGLPVGWTQLPTEWID